jgi:peptidoglycan hydrolase CwlO-like protein
MKQNKLFLIKRLEKKVRKLDELSHEPQNYKKKCDEMEKRIDALEKSVKEALYILGK